MTAQSIAFGYLTRAWRPLLKPLWQALEATGSTCAGNYLLKVWSPDRSSIDIVEMDTPFEGVPQLPEQRGRYDFATFPWWLGTMEILVHFEWIVERPVLRLIFMGNALASRSVGVAASVRIMSEVALALDLPCAGVLDEGKAEELVSDWLERGDDVGAIMLRLLDGGDTKAKPPLAIFRRAVFETVDLKSKAGEGYVVRDLFDRYVLVARRGLLDGTSG